MNEHVPGGKSPKFLGQRNEGLLYYGVNELSNLLENWDDFENPIRELDELLEYYCGDKKEIPINFAIDFWRLHKMYRDVLWPYVRGEFIKNEAELEEHGTGEIVAQDIRERILKEQK